MLNLFIKDLLVQRRILWFGAGYSLFIFVVFQPPVLETFVYTMGSMVIAYIMLLTAMSMDERSVQVLNSLPVTRTELIASRYLSVFWFSLIGLLLTGCIGALLNLSPLSFPSRLLNPQDIIITLSLVGVLVAVYLPFFYWLGSQYVRLLNVVFFLLLFFAPGWITTIITDHPHNETLQFLVSRAEQAGALTVSLLVLAAVLFIMLISWAITSRIYSRKDL